MKSNSHPFAAFHNGLLVNTEDPLNPMPIARALLQTIQDIRASSKMPIIVLAGESHNCPARVFLAYAFLALAYQQEMASSSSSVSSVFNAIEFCKELPQNFIDVYCNGLAAMNLSAEALSRLSQRLPLSELLRYAMPCHAPHAEVALNDYLDKKHIPLQAIDMARTLGFIQVNLPHLPSGSFRPESPQGMTCRNHHMASQLTKGLADRKILYAQVGMSHLFGSFFDHFSYSDSLAALLQPLQTSGKAHVICVALDLGDIPYPEATSYFRGRVIGAQGLSGEVPFSIADDCQTSQEIITKIFNELNMSPIPILRELDYACRSTLHHELRQKVTALLR